MTNLELTFIHPTDDSRIEGIVEASWTANFTIQEMIRDGFLKELQDATREEYRLVYKETGTEFRGETTFAQVGVETRKVISVVIRPKSGATLELTFIHPTDNSSVDATAEASWSANFAIQELIRNGFLKELPNVDREEYRLVYKETMTEFRGETTFAQAGVETGKVISVVIRPMAGGDHRHYYDSDDDLRAAFQNALRSGNLRVDLDEEDTHSVEDIFNAWKYETFRSSHSDYDWDDENDDDDDD